MVRNGCSSMQKVSAANAETKRMISIISINKINRVRTAPDCALSVHLCSKFKAIERYRISVVQSSFDTWRRSHTLRRRLDFVVACSDCFHNSDSIYRKKCFDFYTFEYRFKRKTFTESCGRVFFLKLHHYTVSKFLNL